MNLTLTGKQGKTRLNSVNCEEACYDKMMSKQGSSSLNAQISEYKANLQAET